MSEEVKGGRKRWFAVSLPAARAVLVRSESEDGARRLYRREMGIIKTVHEITVLPVTKADHLPPADHKEDVSVAVSPELKDALRKAQAEAEATELQLA